MRMFTFNLLVSGAFYPLLSLFELFLRNSVHRVLTEYFDDPEWMLNQKDGFMKDPLLYDSGFFLRRSVILAEKRLVKDGVAIKARNMLPVTAFGFWVGLFYQCNVPFLKGSVLRSLPGKPVQVDREAVVVMLMEIRDFRNLISHNMPICLHGGRFRINRIERVHGHIFRLLEWMDPEIRVYVEQYDGVLRRLRSLRKVA
jgi:hypothetical protein